MSIQRFACLVAGLAVLAPSASLAASSPLPAASRAVVRKVSNDVDGDGKSDFIWYASAPDTNDLEGVTVQLMNGTTVKATGRIRMPQPGCRIVSMGDFNGDGRVDLLWSYSNGVDPFYHYTMQLLNGLNAPTNVPLDSNIIVDWEFLGVADHNKDGKTDLLWKDSSNTPHVTEMGPTGITRAYFPANIPMDYVYLASGDLNGDGYADALWTASGLPPFAMQVVPPNNSTAPFTGPITSLLGPANWLTDINGDGKADIVGLDDTATKLTVNLMNGATVTKTATFTLPSLEAGANWARWAALPADFNGDGKKDILLYQGNGGLPSYSRYCILYMNGTTKPATLTRQIAPNSEWIVAGTDDYNGDGKADLMFFQQTTREVRVWLSGSSSAVKIATPTDTVRPIIFFIQATIWC